ncbi:sumo ligase, putative [Perkinsus marinus ATCC 50983]|uniref:Sumo ligase, putative n=1 Tax=Perkinsus marinus (strain ATCC 50983 / TXsc) TaxID=423536 RepID=C5LT69_PERM5|nr:sumo ligase, putative [Perkinsus marinus ATCC 50983]EER00037.1 sumo ligase, putative [Perkinsus marinus ATCC 50983]|eukprot:XP_002767319.1 sumo ligase, putative [Perkinsus marinus ATCC 50983]
MSSAGGQSPISPVTAAHERWFGKCTIDQLKDIARHFRLRVGGRKQELIDRLVKYVIENPHAWQELQRTGGNSVFGRAQGDYYGESSAVRGDMYFSHAENAARTFGATPSSGTTNRSGGLPGHMVKDPDLEEVFEAMDPFWEAAPPAVNSRAVLGMWRLSYGKFFAELNAKHVKEWRRQGARVFARMIRCPARSRMKLSSERITHQWPYTLEVRINNSEAVKIDPPKHLKVRRDEPIDITACLSSHEEVNRIVVGGGSKPEEFVLAFVLCIRRTAEDLVKSVPILSSVECRERIRRVLNREGLHDDEDVEIEGSKEEKEGNTRVLPLTCPLSMCPMVAPARGKLCTHMQCFDLEMFIGTQPKMSAFNNRWKCGVCSRVVRPEDLVVDGFVLEVIKATSDASGRPTCDSVHLDKRTLDWSVDPSDYASGSGEESEGEGAGGGGGLSNTKEEEEETSTTVPAESHGSSSHRPRERVMVDLMGSSSSSSSSDDEAPLLPKPRYPLLSDSYRAPIGGVMQHGSPPSVEDIIASRLKEGSGGPSSSSTSASLGKDWYMEEYPIIPPTTANGVPPPSGMMDGHRYLSSGVLPSSRRGDQQQYSEALLRQAYRPYEERERDRSRKRRLRLAEMDEDSKKSRRRKRHARGVVPRGPIGKVLEGGLIDLCDSD